MTKKTLLEICLPFVVLFVFILPVTTTILSHSNTNMQTLPENSFKITNLTNTPITIIGDTQFVNWASGGDGSRENPYIIANYRINCTSSINGVNIQNTNTYFVLVNDTVSHCADGFYFSHVTAGTIIKSFAINNSNNGFVLSGSSTNNTLMNDLADNNSNYGFSLDAFSSNNSLINNVAIQNVVADFSLNDASNNILRNNNATQNGNTGNTIYYYGDNGYGFWILNSFNNVFSNNLAAQNIAAGFLLTGSSNNILRNNLVELSNMAGFSLAGSSNNVLSYNIAQSNGFGDGFYLTNYASSSSSNNTLNSNTASANQNGFLISASNTNTLTNNTAITNGIIGFSLAYSSFNNLQNNVASSNDYGFYLDSSSNNTLISNTGNNNNIYDYYEVDSINNILTDNAFGTSTTTNTHTISSSSDTIETNLTGLIVLGTIILVGIGLVAFVYVKGKTANTYSDIKRSSEYDAVYNNQLDRVSNTTVCPTCGFEILPEDQYCMNCGVKLKT